MTRQLAPREGFGHGQQGAGAPVCESWHNIGAVVMRLHAMQEWARHVRDRRPGAGAPV